MGLEEIEAAYQLFSVDGEAPDDEEVMRENIEGISIALSDESGAIREEIRKNKLHLLVGKALAILDNDDNKVPPKLRLEREVLFAELESTGIFADYVFSIYKEINEANLHEAYKLLAFTGAYYDKNANRLADIREGLKPTSEKVSTLDLVCTDETTSFDMFFTKELARIKAIRPVEKTKKGD